MTIIERVKQLNFPIGTFAVFGSGPMAVRGIRDAHDVDIIVTSEFFTKLKESGEWQVVKLHDLHDSLVKDGISVYESWAPDSWDIPEMIRIADMIDGVPFVKLETLVEWKKIRNDPKDRHDIELIERYLATHQ